MTEAGIPDGVFNVITGNGPAVGRALVRHPGVDKVAFTGSTKTGIDVAEGATSHLARVTLELGGKSAQIVFPDADLEAAANGVIAGVFAASGQTCMAGSRLIVHEDVHDELVERVATRAREIVLGNPLEPATEMGPLANAQQFEKVTGILEAALDQGAHGGLRRRPGHRRSAATSSARRCSPASPRLARRARGDLRPGRGGADVPRGGRGGGAGQRHRVRPRRLGLDARHPPRDARRPAPARGQGLDQRLPRRRPNMPFGGFGASGIGRENGSDVLHEYTETRSIWIETSGATRDPFTLG